mmetsp:Transcript_60679/g.180722  ORF Transcript_60679/g.180722 Transcript_60679/m.180722 type:complete len:215 (-) Transcript_60679:38-682(-)
MPRSSNTMRAMQAGASLTMVPSACRSAEKGASPGGRSGSTATTSVPMTRSYGWAASVRKSAASAVSQQSSRTVTLSVLFRAAFLDSSGSTSSRSLRVTSAPRAATARPAAPQPAPSSSTLLPCQKLRRAPASQLRSSSMSSRSQKARAESQTTAPRPYGSARLQSVASWRTRTPAPMSKKSCCHASLSRTVSDDSVRQGPVLGANQGRAHPRRR